MTTLNKAVRQFPEIFDARVAACKAVLNNKAVEYAQGANRYHNFDKAAQCLNCTPEKALEGMMIKHFVSLQDIINSAENIHHLSPEMVNEKITDTINYIILLEGLLCRRLDS
jgi:hypothetical protein